MNKNEIIKIYGTDFKEMTKKLLELADLISDIPDSAKTIGIKPNLVTPTPASFGATTHPEIIAGIIEYLKENGDYHIVIAEGSWVGDKTPEAFEYCGYNELARQYGVTLFDTQKDSSFRVKCGDISVNVNSCVRDFDYLINVPVLKGHCQTKITCALKNMKGLIPNSEKRRFHTMGLHKPIAFLNTCIKQDFIVIDHICGDLDFEEGGNPVTKNCIMAAKDPVLTDSYVCRLLGYTVEDVEYIRLADEFGVGSSDLSNLRLLSIKRPDDAGRPDDQPLYGSATRKGDTGRPDRQSLCGLSNEKDKPGSYIIRSNENNPDFYLIEENYNNIEMPMEKNDRVLSVKYAVDDADSCSACYGMLIPALSRLKDECLLEKLDHQIAIGQGHRGAKGPLGVGNCTSCFDHYIEGCPPSEEDIYNGIKKNILLKNK